MAFWKTGDYPAPPIVQGSAAQFLDVLALLGLAAAPGLLFVWLLPLPFVPPVICIVAFLLACAFAWFACHPGAARHRAGATARDAASLFTMLWIGAGLASDTGRFIQLFELLARTP